MKKVTILYFLFQFLYSTTSAQIKLFDYISPMSGSSNPTHLDTLGKGGFMIVSNNASRDSIPNLRRKYGMLVFVQSGNKFYKLNTPIILTGDLKDNTNWLELGLSSASDVQGQLNLKLNLADTASMLSSRFARDTASLSDRINLKVNIADTSNMLSQRIARDTSSLSNRINTLERASGGALADSIGNIRAKIKQDSSTITNSLVTKETALSNRINLKVNISDTSAMLSDRFARDTASLSNRINRLAGATDGALADSISLIRTKIKADSTLIGNALKDSSNNLNARINLKLNNADTSNMLTNRIRRDTSFLVQKSYQSAYRN